jgi:hypothetical protein
MKKHRKKSHPSGIIGDASKPDLLIPPFATDARWWKDCASWWKRRGIFIGKLILWD